jgi:hypothetical protein
VPDRADPAAGHRSPDEVTPWGAWPSREWSIGPATLKRHLLHAVIRAHLETFLHEAATRTDGPGLPRFVEDEFRAFLRCGVLTHGFARLRCDGCGLDRLLPFSS